MTDRKIQTIDVHELKKRLDTSPNLCIIDVRENDEWKESHIPGALHIPKDDISSNITARVPEKDCPIYLHCRGGVRSLYAANCLLDLGYSEVYSIEGGIMEWSQCGYPTKTD
jgi:rhodanese-related sulfurtransferase